MNECILTYIDIYKWASKLLVMFSLYFYYLFIIVTTTINRLLLLNFPIIIELETILFILRYGTITFFFFFFLKLGYNFNRSVVKKFFLSLRFSRYTTIQFIKTICSF